MANLEAVARLLAVFVGVVLVGGGIALAYQWLRSFRVIKRSEYDRLQRAETEHQRCQAEWDRLCTLDNWAKEIRIGSRNLVKSHNIQVEPEFDARESVRNRK